jgi:hypothetical protein
MGQVKMIHALRNRLGIDEPTYRDMLADYGVTSCADDAFTKRKAADLIDKLESQAINAGVWEKRSNASKSGITPKQLGKIRAMWKEVSYAPEDEREKALDKFVNRITGVTFAKWLSREDVPKIMAALARMQKQTKGDGDDSSREHTGTAGN